jgi:hypothetical protein
LELLNFIPEAPAKNKIFEGCCCEFTFSIFNNGNGTKTFEQVEIGGDENCISLVSVNGTAYTGGPVSPFPITIEDGESFEVTVEVCANGA